jgi:ABC-2 type transport system ATP-binding protein
MKALSINNLIKTYQNGVHALKDISFSVEEGDFFALLGPNGAGKSTIIGIITSLVNKSSGSVSVYGYDIDQDFAAAKACVGVVPQEFNFNVFERAIDILINQAGYYGIPRQQAIPRAEKYLKQLGLWEKRRSAARSLSGGMKRRLMIARALIHEPRMLILDEPTAGVDIEVRRLMWVFLRDLNRTGVTIILTTHYLEEAENLCRNIAIIDKGKIVENTSMSNILKQLDTERFILYLQQPLLKLPDIAGYRFWTIDDTTLEVEIPRDLGMNKLFAELQAQQIQILSMRNKANRLEELFLKLTGERNR